MILRLFGAALLLAVSAYLLRCFSWRGAPVFAVLCAVVLLMESGESLSYIFGAVNGAATSVGVNDSVSSALKVLGLGYLFGICADVCRELGEGGIAKAVEVVGRVEIIAVVMPFFEEIIKVGVELIG